MFSEQVLARFHNPRFSGPLENATHEGVAGTPGDGPYMHLWLKVNDGVVEMAAFDTYPCPAAIACGSLVAELSIGRTVQWLRGVTAQDVAVLLGGLPDGKGHCADLSVEAAQAALRGARSVE